MRPLARRAVVQTLSVLLLPLTASAETRVVTLGELDVRAASDDREAALRELRDAVTTELARLDLGKTRERFVLSASITKLDTQVSRDRAESVCTVSATLRRARGGALHALLSGRARASDGARAATLARRTALRAAVRGALRRVPEAIG